MGSFLSVIRRDNRRNPHIRVVSSALSTVPEMEHPVVTPRPVRAKRIKVARVRPEKKSVRKSGWLARKFKVG